jgi:hypothetical protein
LAEYKEHKDETEDESRDVSVVENPEETNPEEEIRENRSSEMV